MNALSGAIFEEALPLPKHSLRLNPDLANMTISPQLHWPGHGRGEGRRYK